MRPEDVVRIRHMIEAAETARQFVAGRQRPDLDRDRMLLFALVRAVEIIGEARAGDPRIGSLVGDRRHAQSSDPCLFRSRSRYPVEDDHRRTPAA